jgi:uncharacterized OB-fold protein
VFTCSTVEHAFDRDWTSEIPYTVALIEFADAPGVRLVARLQEDRPGSIPVGATVEPVFGLSERGASLRFRIAAEARGPSG